MMKCRACAPNTDDFGKHRGSWKPSHYERQYVYYDPAFEGQAAFAHVKDKKPGNAVVASWHDRDEIAEAGGIER